MSTATEPDKEPFIARARELLVGQPKTVRGDGDGEGDQEIHCLGTGGPTTFSGDDPLWGYGAQYTVYAVYDNRAKRYTKVWCYFSSSPWQRGETLDVSEALT